jgi:hypothetical protein
MSLCPNNNLIIEWQYPGKEKNKLIGADDYSVVKPWKYDTTNDFNYTFTAKARCSTSSPPPGVAPSLPRNFVAGQEIVVFTTGTWSGPILGFEKFVNGTNVNGMLSYTNRSGGNATSGFCAPRTIEVILSTTSPSGGGSVRLKSVSGSFNEPVVYGDIYDVQFIPTTTPPRTCIVAVNNQCTFTVTKNGQVVYQKTDSVCPVVNYFCGEECPPGTCECTNGSTVCCYDTSTGKVVKSFTR